MKVEDRPRLLLLTVGMEVGGAEELIRESLPLLESEGFRVTLWSLKGGGVVLEELRRAGKNVESLGGYSRWAPALLGKLWRRLQKERFDLLHSHLFWANLAGRFAGRMAGVPVVINSHHTDMEMETWARSLERHTVGLADQVVTCSEAVRRHALESLRLPSAKVVAIPNGVRPERFADTGRRESVRALLGLSKDQPVLGTVGRLEEPVKGLSVLVKSMEQIVSTVPDAVCLVVGDGPSRGVLERTVASRGLSSQIRFLGMRRDVPELLQALDLYVQPSLREGFGLATLEAMASGLPVVASRVGGLEEIVRDGETGGLVPAGRPDLLADRIRSLLRSPEQRARFGREARRRVEDHFTLAEMVRGWAELYRRLLAKKRERRAA